MTQHDTAVFYLSITSWSFQLSMICKLFEYFEMCLLFYQPISIILWQLFFSIHEEPGTWFKSFNSNAWSHQMAPNIHLQKYICTTQTLSVNACFLMVSQWPWQEISDKHYICSMPFVMSCERGMLHSNSHRCCAQELNQELNKINGREQIRADINRLIIICLELFFAFKCNFFFVVNIERGVSQAQVSHSVFWLKEFKGKQ